MEVKIMKKILNVLQKNHIDLSKFDLLTLK